MSTDTGSSAASSSSGAARWLVLGAAAFWGSSATLARHLFRDLEAPPLMVVELRLVIACALLGPWLAWRHPERLRVRREDRGYFLVLGLLGVAAVQATYYYSIARLGVGLAILLQYVAPSLIVAYRILRGRRVAAVTIAAVAAALAGTALLVRGAGAAAGEARPLDWIVGFGSAVSFAFYVLYSKRGLERYEPGTVLFHTFVVAAAFWALWYPPWTILARHDPARTWAAIVTLGVFSTLVPFSLFYAGLRRLPPTQAGVLATFEPVVAMLSAWALLGESLGPLQWVGAALVIGAALLATRAPSGETARRE